MSQELTGLEYLKKKEIKNMKCNMDKPFAFISYSHDDYDSQIVMNVFKRLMSRGHNLWIDTANMPADEHTWKKSARDALRNRNCKLAFFFRSESSMVKETIAKELKTIIILKHIKSIVTVDIWHEADMDADTYYAEVMNDESKDIDSCDLICECVSTECKAIRLAGDAGNDIIKLVEEMEEELKEIEDNIAPTDVDVVVDNTGEDENLGEDEVDEDEVNDEDNEESDDNNFDEESDKRVDAVEIVSDGSIYHIKGRDGIYDAFYRKDGDKYAVLRGSKVRYNETYTPKKIWEQNKKNITAEGYLLCDINDLAISAAAKLIEGTATSGKELDDNEKLMGLNESYSVNFYASKTVEEVGGKTIPSKKKSEFADGYNYHIYGIEYHAGRREQANLMYDAFNAIISKHPDKVGDIVANCTSVLKKSDISDVGTRNAMPPYFRMCKEFTINGEVYVVGSSYGFEPKIAQIYGMIDACGEDRSIFELEGFEQKKKKDKMDNGEMPKAEQVTGFEYTLWGISHTSNRMSDMMHDVFDLIAEKYPGKISELATSDAISSVARKDDVDGKNLPASKLNYFRASREHNVNGIAYYVGTSYNRSQGIGQIERMLKICEGSADSFVITSSPERISHSGGNTGKKGIGELL